MDNLVIRKKLDNDVVPWDLLLMADPSRENIQQYINDGELYLAYISNDLVGEYVLVKTAGSILEIKNIAVQKDNQNQGVGRALVVDAIERAKEQNSRSIRIGTGNSSLSQLALYQKCGFRIVEVIKDFFIKNYKQEIIENGIKCTDMIVLEIRF